MLAVSDITNAKRKRHMSLKKTVTALSLFFAMDSMAVPFDCNVSLTTVLIYSSGMVNVLHSGRGDYTVICSLDAPLNGVSVTTCAMWTSMLLNLKDTGKKATFYYDTNLAGVTSCSTLPTYGNAPAPVYIGPAVNP
jgi:hypothetical protein